VASLLEARPPLLLLDQPAAALGAGARAALLDMLERRDAEATAVVHAATDAAELFAAADRIAVLAEGTLAQHGTPRDIYDRPVSLAVARLGGALNEFGGVLLGSDETGSRVRLDDGREIDVDIVVGDVPAGGHCVVCVRPERMAAATLAAEQLGAQALPARVHRARFMGDHVMLWLATANAMLLVRRHAALPPREWPPGGTVSVAWAPHDALIFPRNANAP
jgi:ABC-type Fe3+/spermidine/putrescine transport system ATPase subunit